MLHHRRLLAPGGAAAALLLSSALNTSAFGTCSGPDRSHALGSDTRNRPLRWSCSTRRSLASTRRSSTVACEASTSPSPGKRNRQTKADRYYAQYGKIPQPKVVHAVLPDPRIDADCADGDDSEWVKAKKGILIVGDVHGCLAELLSLVSDAIDTANDGHPFRAVVLVGDLCNKGPSSAAVVKHVRTTAGWYAVRGNHDDGALAAALGDEERRAKRKYLWVMDGEGQNSGQWNNSENGGAILTDDDVSWLSELPYTLAIPGSYFEVEENASREADVLVVHAGLVPGVPLEDQTVETMITLREVSLLRESDGSEVFVPHQRKKKSDALPCKTGDIVGDPVPWASVYRGQPLIVFGHDARRGLQRYKTSGDWAIGLDTGACYGKRLSGLVLPGRKVVSVESLKIHSPIGGNDD